MFSTATYISSLLLLSSIASALPQGPPPPPPQPFWLNSTPSTPTVPLQVLAAANAGASALPTPTSQPFAIAVGVGTQNYTCNGASWVQTGAQDGAKATLYNATQAFEANPALVTTIAATALQVAQNFPGASIQSDVIGVHYFDFDNRPTFNLTAFTSPHRVLSAAKVGDVKAPNPSANVDWLYLVDAQDGITQNLRSAYRAETAGGVATGTCSSSNEGAQQVVPYSAQYWLYD